jgi:lysozyme
MLLRMLKRHEGTGPLDDEGNFMPYTDSEGYLTVGYGICLDCTGLRPHEADFLLYSRVDETQRQLRLAIPWFSRLSPVRQAALTDMAYNLGITKFLGFKKTIDHLKHDDWAGAAREMLDSRWAEQVGERAVELSEMIRTGSWQ